MKSPAIFLQGLLRPYIPPAELELQQLRLRTQELESKLAEAEDQLIHLQSFRSVAVKHLAMTNQSAMLTKLREIARQRAAGPCHGVQSLPEGA